MLTSESVINRSIIISHIICPFTQSSDPNKIRLNNHISDLNCNRNFISRARPTINLPGISPQSSVTCNGEYRRPVIKAQPSFHDVDAENGERNNLVPRVLSLLRESTLVTAGHVSKHANPSRTEGESST